MNSHIRWNRLGLFLVLLLGTTSLQAQIINAVEYGRNRVQYKKFKWEYLQSLNFNVYFNQGGESLGKYVLQAAEEELPDIESFTEYGLQRRANVIVYNEFADMQQSNIGLGIDWQTSGGATKLVNNKVVVYFNGDHAHLRKQIREGIARIIVDNVLFGDDIGEFASNQALLDLPKWLTDGYVAYAAENWSTKLDDELKSEILSGNYRKFYAFAFDKPRLAGHAFWYFIEENYKKENTTYLLYLARVYKNLNRACLQVCKKKFKDLLAEFMEYQEEKYYQDIAKRKPYPKGNFIESFDINKRQDYYRINVNPIAKNNAYAMVEYRKGLVKVKLNEDFNMTTLLKYGIRSYQNETNPEYPLLAWDPKGTRLAVVYKQEGKLRLFIYDVVTRIKNPKIDLTEQFQQIQDVKFMLDSRTLLFSAVKNGQTDIFTLNLQNEKVQQITNDIYDDLDATFVSFPGKTGIIFSSNRPNPEATTGDTVLPSRHRYNIFLISNASNKAELNQITQLSNLQYGNARYPMPYNSNHFTFISDENGVANRYAGFFTTQSAGLDTLVLIGDDILRNPAPKDVDSLLRVYKKEDVDSVAVVAISKDSAYTFPLSNYESNVAETRVAGENNQVSEVTRQSDEKILYKLKIDDNTLKRRNITVPPTRYMRRVIMNEKVSNLGNLPDPAVMEPPRGDRPANNNAFVSEFDDDPGGNKSKTDSTGGSKIGQLFKTNDPARPNTLERAKRFPYKPMKFGAEYAGVGFNNAILFNRFQPYAGGAGPIQLGSETPLNGLIRLGTSELMEDIKITGGFRLSTNLRDNEWLLNYQNLRRRLDWGVTYYRNGRQTVDNNLQLFTRTITNLAQGTVSYPFDATKRISLSLGVRQDRQVYVTDIFDDLSIRQPDRVQNFLTSHMEYVYDNTLNPAQNIWNGMRYKIFIDWNTDISKEKFSTGRFNFNWGADFRYYYPIYRNFIWAGRAAADFSWGSQKTVYYLGGADGWLMFGNNFKRDGSNRYFNTNNQPANDSYYAFQSLAVNMRGFLQNVANGNNAITMSSEFRLPVVSTFFNRPVNNAFLRNFQLTQFIDIGTAWNGGYNGIRRPSVTYGLPPVQVVSKVGGIGPFAAGYGFGARSTLLGYFLKFDAGWPMTGFFRGKPILYLSMGLDF
jgi:hypothetical protein